MQSHNVGKVGMPGDDTPPKQRLNREMLLHATEQVKRNRPERPRASALQARFERLEQRFVFGRRTDADAHAIRQRRAAAIEYAD